MPLVPPIAQKMLEEAKSNPEAFAAKLTPEQRKKLSELAKQIESGNAQKP